MELISNKNLKILTEMGFEVTYRTDDYIKFYHGIYDRGIELYYADKKDEYKGVYMDITRDGIVVKSCKGRNVISNITRYIEKHLS